jgi:glycosyltransferase involved in cell wall biosynthesis
MRLAVNLRLFVKGQIGGMENYVRHILAGIAREQAATRQDWTVFARQSEVHNVREIAPGADVIAVEHETAETTINQALERKPHDLFFCPLLVLEPLQSRIPSVVALPDIQHEFFPEFFDSDTLAWRKRTFQPSIHCADVVFTISEFSKSTIVGKYGVDPAKVVVAPLDVDPEFRSGPTPDAERAYAQLGLPEKYIYFPANFWKHKNHSTLLRALRLLLENGCPDLHLVLTGAPSTGMDRVQAEAAKLRLTPYVKFLGYLNRSTIAQVYRHARALAFVSLFEGFGIPILEAFHVGTPVITSRSTSCPEIAGGAAALVDERDPAAIADEIRTVLDDASVRAELIGKGRLRASRYSWTDTVDLTLRTFRAVVEEQRRAYSVAVREKPLVSIVTPTYNMGRFLEETIQSVLSQDYPRIEYIVIDGGSTDDSLDILRKYEGRLQYRSEPDKGQSDAINKGFDLSHGEIFTFLNADDTYLPGAVGAAATNLIENPKAGLVYGDANYVDEAGSVIQPYPTKPYSPELLNRNCFICQPASFMRRDAFLAAGKMNPALHIALDYDLWIRIAKIRPLVKIESFLATSRMYGANKTMAQRSQGYREICQVVKRHFGYVPYEWVYGYADYLISRKDQFFAASRPSISKSLLSFPLGLLINRTQLRRFSAEWWKTVGIGADFTGKWEDGWISRLYNYDFDAGPDCQRIVIQGRNMRPFRKGLTLSLRLNGTLLERAAIRELGVFQVALDCPPDARGRSNRLTIESDRIFRPIRNGDYRQVSCLIDSVTAEHSGGQFA